MEWKNGLATLGLVLLCFFGIPLHLDTNTQEGTTKLFNEFIIKFNKSYGNGTEEYKYRLTMFQYNLRRIKSLNSMKTHNKSARYGLTRFSDMSPEEFLHNNLQPELHKHILRRILKSSNNHSYELHRKVHNHVRKRAILPDKVDWREKKVITPIKNQKTCGACWAFSTVETVEAMHALKSGKLETLSIQQVIDCAGNGNMGCDGGDTCSVLDWMKTEKVHLMPDKGYPLTLINGKCPLERPTAGIQVADYTCDMFVGQEELLLTVLSEHGPVAVAVNAINWQNYVSGVIQFHCDGSPESVNHAVQIIGYDKAAEVPHYIIRNSWGTDFGDKGYLYIAIGGNLCGVATEVSAVDVVG